MAAKGALLKQEIANQIINLFSGRSFLYNDGKEIRINGVENGENLQIKVTLTCAKTAVNQDEVAVNVDNVEKMADKIQEPTSEEKKKLAELLDQLGMTNG